MRRKIIVGNWKMNKTPSEAKNLITALIPLVNSEDVDVVFCVPFVSLVTAYEATKDTNVTIGAQNMYFEEKGAFTGEISPAMVYDAGARYVIVGHSERRAMFGETDESVNKKIKKAFEHGIIPIVCCGETLEQREEKITLQVVENQIKKAFDGIRASDARRALIAYEPIWAIGTGKVATGAQAEEVCEDIRKVISELYGEEVADVIRIQYGGSVNVGNAREILTQPNIDGALVGGASLSTDFAKIIRFNE